MQTEGASAIFVAVVAVIVGSIVLSGSALLVLREEAPSVTPSAIAEATATDVAASGAQADSTVAPSPTVTASRTSTPTPTARPTRTPTPSATTPSATPGVEYTVRPGDALDLIAARFGVASAAIVEENGLVPPYVLEVGQVLVIPVEE